MEQSSHLLKSHWTVLNIEDDTGNVLLLQALFTRRSDLRLLTAITGRQGCEMAQGFLPDTILMDISSLRDISGFDALSILKGNPATAHIPVIAVSADSYPHQIDRGLKVGFFQYLTMPYRLNDLMDAIDDALRHAAEKASK